MPEPVARLIHRIAKVDGLPDVIAKTYAEYAENFYPATWREGDKLYGPEVLEMLAAEKLKLAKVMEGLREISRLDYARSAMNGAAYDAVTIAKTLLRTIEGETSC